MDPTADMRGDLLPEPDLAATAGLPREKACRVLKVDALLGADLAGICDFENLEVTRAAGRVDLDRIAGLASD
jgi:hypothetical protein